MDHNIEKSTVDAMEHNEKDNDSSTPGTPPVRSGDVEKMGTSPAVDAETEKRLLRKLDIRIIPMVCWIYLMNFMDRVGYSPDPKWLVWLTMVVCQRQTNCANAKISTSAPRLASTMDLSLTSYPNLR